MIPKIDIWWCTSTDCRCPATRFVVVNEKNVVPLCNNHFGGYITNLEKKSGLSYREASLSEIRVFDIMKS